jgi:hypothetical protein
MVRQNPAPRLAGVRSPFAIFGFGFLTVKLQSPKRLQTESPNSI